MYVGAAFSPSSGGTNAQADFATNLIVYCLSTVTNVSVHFGPFTGIIYAPNANVTLSAAEVFGSIAARALSTFATCSFHYDEQIARWYPPMHPGITSARFVSGVGLQFDVSGPSGLQYVVETSTNLTDWIPSKTNASPFTYTDPETSLFPNRFYRAFWAPYPDLACDRSLIITSILLAATIPQASDLSASQFQAGSHGVK